MARDQELRPALLLVFMSSYTDDQVEEPEHPTRTPRFIAQPFSPGHLKYADALGQCEREQPHR